MFIDFKIFVGAELLKRDMKEFVGAEGGGHGDPLQYSCLGNPMDRGAWQVTVHRVTKSWTQLSN